MKVLVTGANGYIGRHVVNALTDQGVCVVACDLSPGDRGGGVSLALKALLAMSWKTGGYAPGSQMLTSVFTWPGRTDSVIMHRAIWQK